jgi:hypothetical protein
MSLESSHVPMLSQPERVIDVIRTAVKSVQPARQQPKARQGYVLASGLSLATCFSDLDKCSASGFIQVSEPFFLDDGLTGN